MAMIEEFSAEITIYYKNAGMNKVFGTFYVHAYEYWRLKDRADILTKQISENEKEPFVWKWSKQGQFL